MKTTFKSFLSEERKEAHSLEELFELAKDYSNRSLSYKGKFWTRARSNLGDKERKLSAKGYDRITLYDGMQGYDELYTFSCFELKLFMIEHVMHEENISEVIVIDTRQYMLFVLGPVETDFFMHKENLENKEALIKRLLFMYTKIGEFPYNGKGDILRAVIALCRQQGYDYPEFKAIEKSIHSV